MIAPFLDYEVREMIVSNGSSVTYTLPRKAFVTCGRYRRDDTGGIYVYCSYVDTVQDSDSTTLYLMAYDPGNDGANVPSLGSHVFEAGRVIRVDAPDDARVTLHIFYLPESP